MNVPSGTTAECDLVVVAVPGVQQFISEARSTADVAAASRIVSELTAAMVAEVIAPAEVVLPATGVAPGGGAAVPDGAGLPNRVVVLTAPGQGRELAIRMAAGAKRLWSDRVAAVWPGGPPVESPGFPDIHWVCVEPAEGGYREQWTRASAALAARRSTRTFAAYDVSPARRICSVSGRWPAVEQLPPGVPHRRGEALSVPAVVKRKDRRQVFPSTASVATGPFRRALAHKVVTDAKVRAAVVRLRTAVDFLSRFGIRFGSGRLPGIVVPSAGPGADEARWLAGVEGVCLLAETWSTRALSLELAVTPADRQGFEVAVAACAARLADLLAVADLDPPATYLAVVVQDADSMGRRLAAGADQHGDARGWHGQVSAALVRAAHAQRDCLERGATADDDEPPLGRMVYVGGDDALGFVPARSAFAAATALNAAFRRELVGTAERPGPVPAATASTAVVFCHVSAPLQSVLTAARQLLGETKDVFRPGFGVAVWRRGGERVRAVRPWQVGPSLPLGVGAPEALEILVALMHAGLSGRLVADLERDAAAIATLSTAGHAGELRRLIRRHGGPEADVELGAQALLALSDRDLGDEASLRSAAGWAAIARFVAAEGR